MILTAVIGVDRLNKMPRGPKGERLPADVNGRAVMIARIAKGEIDDIIVLIDPRDARLAQSRKARPQA